MSPSPRRTAARNPSFCFLPRISSVAPAHRLSYAHFVIKLERLRSIEHAQDIQVSERVTGKLPPPRSLIVRVLHVTFSLVALMGFLESLSDVPALKAPAAYDRAQKAFIHGYLVASQRESDLAYRRFLYADPVWARKFQLLQATTMVWRSLQEDALATLADDRIPWSSNDDKVERLALQATALIYLHRLPEAEQSLAQADILCAAKFSIQCGAVLNAHGSLFDERGQTPQAQQAFLATLSFARASQDGMLEATALLNLGRTATIEEHHDEALEYDRLSFEVAHRLDAGDLEQTALGNEGFEQYSMGNPDKALSMFEQAGKRAAALGDTGDEIELLSTSALAYVDINQLARAEASDLKALKLAYAINRKQKIIDVSMDLAQIYLDLHKPEAGEAHIRQARLLAAETGSRIDLLTCDLLSGETAVALKDFPQAEQLLGHVIASPYSQSSMKWQAEHSLGNAYEAAGNLPAAEQSYKAALALVEAARNDLKQDVSKLTFFANAAQIYDDYIHLLVSEGRQEEALEAADWSRARTLQQDSTAPLTPKLAGPPKLQPRGTARRANATLLFYWLGERQSYLWAISPSHAELSVLPARSVIIALMDRYRRTLLSLKDPANDGDKDGRALYDMLIAPASALIGDNHNILLFVDGAMGQLNFDTLVVSHPAPHYWIDDANIVSAPSIRVLTAAIDHPGIEPDHQGGRLLLLGNSISPDAEFPALPMAAPEMKNVANGFSSTNSAIFSGASATPAAYLGSKPEQFAYIHLVTHATANSVDPLDSAVVLSRAGPAEDSFKLYARDILRHPIHARLVTISACNSSGSKAYVGEGLVGISWAFLRAGAHNAIGSLWEVSDASTPEFMDHLYTELQQGKSPAVALRDAKLSLLHARSSFSRPFYWAPFQLYSGR